MQSLRRPGSTRTETRKPARSMKRIFFLSVPPVAFGLAAFLGWCSGQSPDLPVSAEHSQARPVRQKSDDRRFASDPLGMLARMETAILPNPAPPRATYDAAGMTLAILNERSPGVPEGGISPSEYAYGWARDSPETMFEWLLHGRRLVGPDRMFSQILFSSWAKSDLKAALAAWSRLPGVEDRRQALMPTLQMMCKTDPPGASGLLAENLELFSESTGVIPFDISEHGPNVLTMMLSLAPGETRTRLLVGYANRIGSGFFLGDEYMEKAWSGLPASERTEWVAAGLNPSMTKKFPGIEHLLQEQADAAGSPPDEARYFDPMGEVRGDHDPATALAWIEENMKGRARVDLSVTIFEAAASRHLDQALASWQALPDSILKDRAADAIRRRAPVDRNLDVRAILDPAGDPD